MRLVTLVSVCVCLSVMLRFVKLFSTLLTDHSCYLWWKKLEHMLLLPGVTLWNYRNVNVERQSVKISSVTGLLITGIQCLIQLFLHLHWTASTTVLTSTALHWSSQRLCETLPQRSVNRPLAYIRLKMMMICRFMQVHIQHISRSSGQSQGHSSKM